MPILYDWFSKVIGASLEKRSLPQPEMTADQIPKAIINDSFMLDLKKTNISYSDDPQDRLFRAHGWFNSFKCIHFWLITINFEIKGHTMDELFILRYGKFERIPDIVVWPGWFFNY